jgi:hypothetical protein
VILAHFTFDIHPYLQYTFRVYLLVPPIEAADARMTSRVDLGNPGARVVRAYNAFGARAPQGSSASACRRLAQHQRQDAPLRRRSQPPSLSLRHSRRGSTGVEVAPGRDTRDLYPFRDGPPQPARCNDDQ